MKTEMLNSRHKKSGRKKLGKANEIQSYLMLFPSLIGTLIFVVYPLIWVIRWSLFRYDGMFEADYVGFYNFVTAIKDSDFWNSVQNTFFLTLVKLCIEVPMALVIAVLLNTKIFARNIHRSIYFMPTVLSVAIMGIVFSFIFASYDGVVNNILLNVKLIKAPISWFGSKWTALAILGVATIWHNFGINMIYFLTGLQSIPKELYECAEIDGASKVRQFTHITIPMLGPVLQVIIMLTILASMKITELVLVLTGGRPAGQTEVMMTFVYKKFFPSGLTTASNYGYASALAVIAAIILGVVTISYLKLSDKSTDIY